jgi:peptidoglycan glycosyltransferase
MSLIVELIKYLMIMLMGIYSFYSFRIFSYRKKEKQDKAYGVLTTLIFLIHFIGYATLLLQVPSLKLVILYLGEVFLFLLVLSFYSAFYPKLSRLLLRNMLMLLTVSFIILARLSLEDAIRQVLIIAGSFLVCLIVPFFLIKLKFLKRFGWVYGASGIGILLVVLILGKTTFGATNWLQVMGISTQPSEFVKLLFVFSIAALLKEETISFRRVCAIAALAGVNVIILVLQRDLGGALIFFVTFVFMLYAATSRPLYLFSGLLGGSIAAIAAYQLFYHVRVRVMAWSDPFKYIDDQGYQITQSLFAIGTGGWFGMGINRGLPTDIPVVENDFIFSAISEELGGLFAICIILIYISCFVMMINMAIEQEEAFYRLLSIGFSVMFAFQVFLSIGGVIKFIPSTGVTLPLISQGGSSAFATILLFMILQGVFIRGKNTKKEAKMQGREMEYYAEDETEEV